MQDFPQPYARPTGQPVIPPAVQPPNSPVVTAVPRLRMELMGHRMSFGEYKKLQKCCGDNQNLPWILNLITGGFISMYAESANDSALAAIGFVVLLVFTAFYLMLMAQVPKVTYQAPDDTPDREFLYRIYDDRIEMNSPLSHRVFPLATVTAVVQLSDMMIFNFDGSCVVLRGADMTGFDARFLTELVHELIPADRIREKGTLYGQLPAPFGIHEPPKLPRQIVATATVAITDQDIRKSYNQHFLLLLPMAASSFWIFGAALSGWVSLTAIMWCDTLLFFAAFLLLTAVAMLLFRRSAVKKTGRCLPAQTVRLEFIPEGLLIGQRDHWSFIPCRKVTVLPATDGFSVRSPLFSGKVSWTVVDQPDNLRRLFGV